MKPNPALIMRMKRELELIEQSPPQGISAWPKDDKISTLEANIDGPQGTPYEKGTFKLEINIPDRYFIFTIQIYSKSISQISRDTFLTVFVGIHSNHQKYGLLHQYTIQI